MQILSVALLTHVAEMVTLSRVHLLWQQVNPQECPQLDQLEA